MRENYMNVDDAVNSLLAIGTLFDDNLGAVSHSDADEKKVLAHFFPRVVQKQYADGNKGIIDWFKKAVKKLNPFSNKNNVVEVLTVEKRGLLSRINKVLHGKSYAVKPESKAAMLLMNLHQTLREHSVDRDGVDKEKLERTIHRLDLMVDVMKERQIEKTNQKNRASITAFFDGLKANNRTFQTTEVLERTPSFESMATPSVDHTRRAISSRSSSGALSSVLERAKHAAGLQAFDRPAFLAQHSESTAEPVLPAKKTEPDEGRFLAQQQDKGVSDLVPMQKLSVNKNLFEKMVLQAKQGVLPQELQKKVRDVESTIASITQSEIEQDEKEEIIESTLSDFVATTAKVEIDPNVTVILDAIEKDLKDLHKARGIVQGYDKIFQDRRSGDDISFLLEGCDKMLEVSAMIMKSFQRISSNSNNQIYRATIDAQKPRLDSVAKTVEDKVYELKRKCAFEVCRPYLKSVGPYVVTENDLHSQMKSGCTALLTKLTREDSGSLIDARYARAHDELANLISSWPDSIDTLTDRQRFELYDSLYPILESIHTLLGKASFENYLTSLDELVFKFKESLRVDNALDSNQELIERLFDMLENLPEPLTWQVLIELTEQIVALIESVPTKLPLEAYKKELNEMIHV